MGKLVAVTGATGFIGSHITRTLTHAGYQVRAIDVRREPTRAHLYQHAEYVEADLRDPEQCVEALTGADWVMHFASDMGGVGYFHGPNDYRAAINNLRMDLNVLRSCERLETGRLFLAGSFCAYPTTDQRLADDGRAVRAMTETDLGGGPAEALYGEAKRMTAMLAAKASGDVRVALFSTIYGPTQEYLHPLRSKFPTAILRRVLQHRQTGDPLVVWGDGTQVRTFLYIDDAVDRIMRVMVTAGYWGPVNIGSDEQVTIRECTEWACELAGVNPEIRWQPSAPTGVLAKDCDNTVFRTRYGNVRQTSMRNGFAATYDWLATLVDEQVAA